MFWQSRTQCNDSKVTKSHCVSFGNLNDDVSKGWEIVQTIQRDCRSSRYSKPRQNSFKPHTCMLRNYRAFKVIFIGWCCQAEIENGVTSLCAINANVISETNKDTATEKLQIRRFQRPYPVCRLFCNERLRVTDLHFCR